MSDPAAFVLLLLWGIVVSLDERAFGSFAFHQPLVAGTVAGAIAGNLHGGLEAGIVFQALWPGLLPIGGDLVPAAGLAATVAGAVTAWGSRSIGTTALWTSNGPLFLGVLLGLVAAGAGRRWELATRRRNAVREEQALASPVPLVQALARALRGSYADTALRGAAITAGGLLLGGAILLSPSALRLVGGASLSHLGFSLRIAALALGLGGLVFSLQCLRRRHLPELLLGLTAGVLLQLLRRW